MWYICLGSVYREVYSTCTYIETELSSIPMSCNFTIDHSRFSSFFYWCDWLNTNFNSVLTNKRNLPNMEGPSWSWSHGCWIYNYLCNQCLSLLTLWVRLTPRRGVLDTTLCDKVCQWLAAERWFSPGALVSFMNKTDHHITELLLKDALNTTILTLTTWPNMLAISDTIFI